MKKSAIKHKSSEKNGLQDIRIELTNIMRFHQYPFRKVADEMGLNHMTLYYFIKGRDKLSSKPDPKNLVKIIAWLSNYFKQMQ